MKTCHSTSPASWRESGQLGHKLFTMHISLDSSSFLYLNVCLAASLPACLPGWPTAVVSAAAASFIGGGGGGGGGGLEGAQGCH